MTKLNAADSIELGTSTVTSVYVGTTCVWDKDAQVFLVATALTADTTIAPAVHNLAGALKRAGIWTLLDAIYPFVGGSVAAHKFNLKDPRDLDAAYRLTFTGGLTHASTGMVSDGSSGWANTHWVPSARLSANDGAIGCYLRNNVKTAAKMWDMGAADAGTTNVVGCVSALAASLLSSFNIGSNTNVQSATVPTTTQGLWVCNRPNSTTITGWQNGTQTTSGAQAWSAVSSMPLALCAVNINGIGAARFATREQAFAFAGHTLSDTQLAQLYAMVQAFQTALGRQI